MEQRDKKGFDSDEVGPESDAAFVEGDDPAEDDVQTASAGADPGAVADLERRLTDQQDRYLRLAAEYDNFRKRTAKERAEAFGRAQADLVKQLIDPLDDLARFAHVDPSTVDASTVVQGVDMVEKKLLKALTSAGLEAIDPVNQTFDPKLHEAVATEPALSPEDDHVVARVYQVGYLFKEQLLRPARVVVKQWNG
jgi:molecular chaperone GrpE